MINEYSMDFQFHFIIENAVYENDRLESMLFAMEQQFPPIYFSVSETIKFMCISFQRWIFAWKEKDTKNIFFYLLTSELWASEMLSMLSLIEKYSLETPYNMTNSLQFDGFNIQNRIKNETMCAQWFQMKFIIHIWLNVPIEVFQCKRLFQATTTTKKWIKNLNSTNKTKTTNWLI